MSLRTERVGESIREVLAEELPRLEDPRLGLVSITGVDVSPDLRFAQVFVSSLNADSDMEATLAALARARVRLQSGIGRKLRLKRTPVLRFAQDSGISKGERIDRILRELHEADDGTT